MRIVSVLATISTDVYGCKEVITAKQIIITHLSKTNIKDRDKMIKDVNRLSTLHQVWRYYSNALLKFEGMGSNQLNANKKKEPLNNIEESF